LRLTDVTAAMFQQFRDYVDTVLVPIGAIESHGAHAPLGTDCLIAERIVRELEEQFSGRVLALPSIAYGHCFALKDSAGTIDIPDDVLREYVYHAIRPFRDWGIRYVIFVNGHGGNSNALNQVSERLVEDGFTVCISNWWLDYQAEIQKIAPGTGHGGEDETSVIMAIDADLVKLEFAGQFTPTVTPGLRYPKMNRDLYPEGYSGNPAAATSEKGEQILKLVIQRLTQQITSLWLGSY
jgi:creatinine amidohydrolase